MQFIPPTPQNSAQGFTVAFTAIDPFKRQQYQTGTGCYNTTCATLERIIAPGLHAAYTRYCRNARTLHRSAQPQIIPARRGLFLLSANRWQVLHPAHLLMGQRLHLCRVSQAAVSILPTPGGNGSGTGQRSGRTGSARHPPPGGSVQQKRRGVRRGTIGGSRRISFRAFAR